MNKLPVSKFVLGIVVILILLAFTFPFVWMLLASFKTQAQIMSTQHFFSFRPTLQNYVEVMAENQFAQYIGNSLIIGVGATFFALVLGLPAAYAIGKFRLQGLGMVILVVKMIPGIMFLVPWFMLFSNMGMVDTFTSLILSHMLIALPYIVWIMIPFFEALPEEIQESGLIDGCTRFMVFIRIVLPISTPGYMTAALLAFIHSWNNFMFSSILSGDRTKTLPVAMYNFMSYAEINWGAIMAAACIITLPVLLITLMTQKYIVTGLSSGAVKG